jgi:hypothetical protein
MFSGEGEDVARGRITCPTTSVTVEDFEGYIRFRFLDTIAYPGTYRKFMLTRKEQGCEWAILMAKHVNAVQAAVRDLEQKEQELKTSPLSALHIVWQHVAESNLPPSDLQLTIANCSVSRKTAIPCVIIKGKGRGAQPFAVNSRFASFLYDLWAVYKMDILIKTFARQKMDEIDPESKLPMASIAEAFQEKREEVRHLASAFHMAYCHVFRSAVCGLQTLV